MDRSKIIGRRVKLDGETGPFANRCPFSQGCVTPDGEIRGGEGVIAPGAGPHIASIRCATCGRHLSWVSRANLDALAASLPEEGAAR